MTIRDSSRARSPELSSDNLETPSQKKLSASGRCCRCSMKTNQAASAKSAEPVRKFIVRELRMLRHAARKSGPDPVRGSGPCGAGGVRTQGARGAQPPPPAAPPVRPRRCPLESRPQSADCGAGSGPCEEGWRDWERGTVPVGCYPPLPLSLLLSRSPAPCVCVCHEAPRSQALYPL